ncbi:MAG: hypothetical protein JNK82_27320 [Myxococcaceae bacterium]|nr:hypothetical protein [Myxococcaceae bacterium]
MRGLTVGTHFHHVCAACKSDFSVPSTGAISFSFFATLFLAGVGAIVVINPPGAAVGAQDDNRWFGWGLLAFAFGGLVVFAARLRARVLHPAVRTSDAG